MEIDQEKQRTQTVAFYHPLLDPQDLRRCATLQYVETAILSHLHVKADSLVCEEGTHRPQEKIMPNTGERLLDVAEVQSVLDSVPVEKTRRGILSNCLPSCHDLSVRPPTNKKH